MTLLVSYPLVSDVGIGAQDASYTAWLKAKVQGSLDDPRPGIPRDKLMA